MMAAGRLSDPSRQQQHGLPAIADGRVNVPANSNIQAVWKLNEIELRHNIEGEASWHWQHRNSSYIYIGGLDVRLTEGDIIVVFSQWGEPVDIHLVRDKRTGIPKGYAFLAYEDQRSTILAVDNANGMQLLQRTLRVDHCKDYRPPERQQSQQNEGGDTTSKYEATGAEGKGLGVYGVTEDQRQRFAAEKQAKQLMEQNRKQETERAAALHRQGLKDVDEMWSEEFEEMLKQMNKEAEVEAQQLLEAEKAKRRRQKELEREAKAAWKREWKLQKAEEKRKRRQASSAEDEEEKRKKKEKKKHKHKRRKREGKEEDDVENADDDDDDEEECKGEASPEDRSVVRKREGKGRKEVAQRIAGDDKKEEARKGRGQEGDGEQARPRDRSAMHKGEEKGKKDAAEMLDRDVWKKESRRGRRYPENMTEANEEDTGGEEERGGNIGLKYARGTGRTKEASRGQEEVEDKSRKREGEKEKAQREERGLDAEAVSKLEREGKKSRHTEWRSEEGGSRGVDNEVEHEENKERGRRSEQGRHEGSENARK